MPKYTYCCKHCEMTYTISHSLSEIHSVCVKCGIENGLNKIPVSFNYPKLINKDQPPGTIVREVIEDIKQESDNTKQELKGRKYES
jgi:hypothetical protein